MMFSLRRRPVVAEVIDVRDGIEAVQGVMRKVVVGGHVVAVILGGGAKRRVQRHRGQTKAATVLVQQIDEGQFLIVGGVPAILGGNGRDRPAPGQRGQHQREAGEQCGDAGHRSLPS